MDNSTKIYYDNKAKMIHDNIKNKINFNINDYECFINTPYTKSMIRLKFEFDLNEDYTDMIIEESLLNLILSSFNNLQIKSENQIYLSEYLNKSSEKEITDYLDYYNNISYLNDIDKQLNSIKYLYFGEKHIRYLSNFIDINNIKGYCGNYKNIKLFYVEYIDDIFLSNAAIIDLNTIDVKYNEYILKDYFDKYNEMLYENIPNNFKKGVITLNCSLGDIDIIKLKCEFGKDLFLHRKLKLSKILKSNINI